MPRSKKLKKLLLYIVVSAAFVGMILMNLHNEEFGYAMDLTKAEVTAALPNDYGVYIDRSSGYSGAYIRGGWFFMPNAGRSELQLVADTRTEGHFLEVWTTDGRSEVLALRVPIAVTKGHTELRADFYPRADVKYAEIRVVFGGEGYLSVSSFEMMQYGAFSDTWFTACSAALGLAVLGFWLFRRQAPGIRARREDRTADYAVLLAAVIFVSQPTFFGFVLNGHDTFFHIPRIEAVKDMLLAGQFPVRNYASAVWGFGYGSPLYYPDIFLYFPALLRAVGCSQPFAVNTFYFTANFAVAFIAYYSADAMFKNRSVAVVSALLYTTALYRLINVYMRGALGELTAMVFLPLAAAGMYGIFFGDKKRWRMAAVGYTGVIQSHILSVLMAGIFSLLFLIAFFRKILRDGRWRSLLKMMGSVLLVNLWFLLPFLQMYAAFPSGRFMQWVTADAQAMYPGQVMDVFVNAAGQSEVVGSVRGEMGMSLGLSVVLGAAMYLVFLAVRKKKAPFEKTDRIAIGGLVFGLLAVWMASYHFPMRAVIGAGGVGELLNSIQFPWRLLSPATVFLVMTGAVGIVRLGEWLGSKRLTVFVMCVVMVVPTGFFFYRVLQDLEGYTHHTAVPDRLGFYQEYLPEKTVRAIQALGADDTATAAFFDANRAPVFSNPGAELTGYQNSNRALVFSYEGGAGTVRLPLVYYPGFTARDQSGKMLPVGPSEEYFVEVTLEDPSAEVTVRYEGLWYWRVGDAVSLLTLGLFAAYHAIRRLNARKRTQRKRAAG